MNLDTLFLVVALLLALAEEIRARGESLVAWAVVFLCMALLWGRL
jgi:hypothetical protein